MSDPVTPYDGQADAEVDEVEIDDEALEMASGGQMDNSTEIVYASTFVPFDSSFCGPGPQSPSAPQRAMSCRAAMRPNTPPASTRSS